MPVDFLTDEQRDAYGCYHGEPSKIQLARYFHFDDQDLSVIRKRRGNHNRLGFAIQLATVRFLGTFLSNPIDVPSEVVHFIAQQLGINNTGCLNNYLKRRATRFDHCTEIQTLYGYHAFTDSSYPFRYLRWLYSCVWVNQERPSLIFDLSTAWLLERKVLLPGVSTLSRLISKVRERCNQRLWNALNQLPTQKQKNKLKQLLQVNDEDRYSQLDNLRRGPTRASGPSLVSALLRYQKFRDFEVHQLNFSKLPYARLKALARYAATTWAPKLARMPENRRIATLLAFIHIYEIEALDDSLDVLDLLITDITAQAKRLGQKQRLRTLRDLDKAALMMKDVCSLLIDGDIEDTNLRSIVFDQFSKEKLQKAIETVENLARSEDDNYHQELVDRYRRVRVFLPELLKQVEFSATTAGENVLKALYYLKTLEGSKTTILTDAPEDVIVKPWPRLVFDEKNRVRKQAYTLCVLAQLQDKLRRRDIFASGSHRWGDPRIKLIEQKEWESKKLQVCRSLDLPQESNEALTRLGQELDKAYARTLENLPDNQALKLIEDKEHDDWPFVLSNLDKVEEPPSLLALRDKVDDLLPRIDLPELLLEVNTHTGFANEFVHITEQNSRIEHLDISVCATLLGEACNIGLEPLVRPHHPALSRGRLSWILQNYFRADTFTRANARLVDYQNTLKLAHAWGGGDVASADGLRFVTPVKTINSGPNPKYFHSGRGITYYNFVSDQYSGFHGIVIPGTLRDSLYILEGILEQKTSLNPTEIMTDTAGVSDTIFGLFWLLGYQFSPRLADISGSRFWRIDSEKNYGELDNLANHQVNMDRITQHWDDILRVAASLKLGKINASELLRTLLKSDKPSSLAKAIADLGKIPKTIYLLNYIDDESYRRRILTQLNRGEGRHAVARSVCHGQRGEIRKKYQQGQEDQLSALGLVTNAIILWNTLYIESALDKLRSEGIEILPEDVARLSPLQYKHINMLGKYAFILSETIKRGKLRSLHKPEFNYEMSLA